MSALGFAGRFAIYDPDLLDTGDLSDLDPPDVNAIIADPMPSVQGYSSTVDARYAAATGSHQATGGGQDTLAPSAAADGTLDQLDTSVLLTPAEYLVTSAAGGGPAAGPAGTGRRELAAGQRATWYLGGTLEVSKVEVPDAAARQDAAAGVQLGLTTPDGTTQWFRARAMTSSALGITLPGPVASVAVLAAAPAQPAGAGRAGRSAGRSRSGRRRCPRRAETSWWPTASWPTPWPRRTGPSPVSTARSRSSPTSSPGRRSASRRLRAARRRARG